MISISIIKFTTVCAIPIKIINVGTNTRWIRTDKINISTLTRVRTWVTIWWFRFFFNFLFEKSKSYFSLTFQNFHTTIWNIWIPPPVSTTLTPITDRGYIKRLILKTSLTATTLIWICACFQICFFVNFLWFKK